MRATLVLLVLAACSDSVDMMADDGDPLAELQALPGVSVMEVPIIVDGQRHFVLHVTQPVDHNAPGGPTFQQEVSLIHLSHSAPMVAFTSGYDDYYRDSVTETASLLGANQISIEHRFFGSSRPQPADWSMLTIAQMAADEHAIISLLKPIYRAAWLSSGGSKGGMTALYHRRFFPDDVAGTVAYVAPQSFGVPDARYDSYLDGVGSIDCRAAVRALATEMLANRRAALLARAQADATANQRVYSRIAIGPALESAIRDFEWTYWQYDGINQCASLPTTAATDDELWRVLEQISPVEFSDDDSSARFEAYFYQAYNQLGSPGLVSVRGDSPPHYLDQYVQYTEADYRGTFPLATPLPAFDADAMRDIDAWLEHNASHVILVYGEWDPWTGGRFSLGDATDSAELIAPHGTHRASLTSLGLADRELAFAMLTAWTGVTPKPSPLRSRLIDVEPRRHGPQR